MITIQRLKELVTYDAETGCFAWVRRMRGVKPGRAPGHLAAHGYWTIRLDQRPYYAHRLAWLYMTGEWPALEVDHINGNPSDNRWTNLRAADRTQNVVNRPRRRDSSSGFKGVYRARSGRFTCQVRIDGKARHLGTFDTAEEAFAARNAEAQRLYGEFYRSD